MKSHFISTSEQERWIVFIMARAVNLCLFCIIAVVPLVLIPSGIDYWYQPKIYSIYGLLLIISFSLAIQQFVFKKRFFFKATPLAIPLIAYGVASLLSTVFSISPGLSIFGDIFREEGIFTILSYITLNYFFSILVKSEKQIRSLIKGLLVSCSIISLYAIVQYFGFNPTKHFISFFNSPTGRFGSTIGNANFLGKFLVLILPLFIVYYFVSVHKVEKLLLLTGGILAFTALIETFTRASWLGFSFSFFLFPFFLGKKILLSKRKEIAAIIAIIIVFAIIFQVQSSIKKLHIAGKSVPTVTQKVITAFDLKKGMGVATRLFAWEKAIIRIKEKPLLGFGLDTHLLVMKKFNLEYLRKFNDLVVIDRVHNNYLDIAIAQGLIGLAAYLSIVITFLLWLVRTRREEREPSQKIIYSGILSAFCGYLVNDFFIFSVVSVSPTFWALMGITIAMKNTVSKNKTVMSKTANGQ